uniref:Uncharacterized protein n=1 Tax=Amphimedon queenslandica TaxID=400682 RepID=A0A1X7U9E2_AMPQE
MLGQPFLKESWIKIYLRQRDLLMKREIDIGDIASIAATDEASHNFTQSVAIQVDPIVTRSVKVQTVKVKSSVVNRVSVGTQTSSCILSSDAEVQCDLLSSELPITSSTDDSNAYECQDSSSDESYSEEEKEKRTFDKE